MKAEFSTRSSHTACSVRAGWYELRVEKESGEWVRVLIGGSVPKDYIM